MIISMPSILGALNVFWIWEFVLTYLWKISFLSWWSSSMLTDRSEMETAVEAVRVTSSTSVPSPSSRATSSLCVHSFERRERSTWHLTRTQYHHHYHVVLQDITCMTREKHSRIRKKTPKQNKWVFFFNSGHFWPCGHLKNDSFSTPPQLKTFILWWKIHFSYKMYTSFCMLRLILLLTFYLYKYKMKCYF